MWAWATYPYECPGHLVNDHDEPRSRPHHVDVHQLNPATSLPSSGTQPHERPGHVKTPRVHDNDPATSTPGASTMSTTRVDHSQGDGKGGDKADEDEDERRDDRQGGFFAPSRLSCASHDDSGGGVHHTHRPVPSLSHCHPMMQGVVPLVSVNGSTLFPLFIVMKYY